MFAHYLLAASAFIILALGLVHLIYTFATDKFDPRDAALKVAMEAVSPVITRQTTMWRAWVGFNASHSYGAILFGWIYGYLALAQTKVLFASTFLLGTGLVVLVAYAWLGWRYWFKIPFRGIVISLSLYVLALVGEFA
ncbi:LIC_13387 family protein [Caenimonas koreensis]|uniref:DUF1304 domain-containing protein n=1 Tax=Caenimonas koreensis DSM 17982 TaxID=1121255 RepID=A0A844B9G4_9BURK|nr:hypothetical protein [Caenimonas koreensis]MRD48239.1 hypothetical protein [Caenimonas koreensis DSM 17982]